MIADALQYGTCPSYGKNGDGLTPPYKPKATSVKPLDSNLTIYVNPTAGSDDNSGSASSPLKTILGAIKLYREKRLQGGTISLMQGDYLLAEPIVLGPQDNGLTILGQSVESVRVFGARYYKFSWNLHKTVMAAVEGNSNAVGGVVKGGLTEAGVKLFGHTLSARECQSLCEHTTACTSFTWFDDTVHNVSRLCFFRIDQKWDLQQVRGAVSGRKADILVADLSSQNPAPFSSLFINGRRAVRARYPNGNPETTGLHTNPTGYTTAVKWLPPETKPPAYEIHINSPMRNGTHFPTFQIGIGGPVEAFNPPESYWGTANPVGGGGFTYKVPTGLQYKTNEDFINRKWSNPSTGVVHALHCQYWGGWQFAIDDRDMNSQTITWSRGGFQEARGCDSGKEYYIDNIFEELDTPGEWFYDEKDMKLYLMPNSSTPPEIGYGTQLDRLFGIEGTMDEPVKNITLSGMTLAYTQPTYLKDYEVPSGGDWTVHRDGMIFIEGAENITVEGNVFDSPGGNGLIVTGYARNVAVRGNEFKFVGDNVVVVLGRADLMDATTGTQPRHTIIDGHLMREFGIWGKQTCALGQSLGTQTTFVNNIFFNGPRAGININDGLGGGNLIKKNIGFNMVRETGDHGVLNSWDRQPYVTKVRDGTTPSLIPATSNLTLNMFINNYHSAWPIDHDDGSCYYYDTLNVLVYGGFKNYLGHTKIAKYNLYIFPDLVTVKADGDVGNYFKKPYCANSDGAGTGPFPSGWGDVWANNTCIIGNPNIYEFNGCSQNGDISRLVPFTANNTFFANSKDIYIACDGKKLTLEQYQSMGYDVGSVVEDMIPVEDIISMAKALLGIS